MQQRLGGFSQFHNRKWWSALDQFFYLPPSEAVFSRIVFASADNVLPYQQETAHSAVLKRVFCLQFQVAIAVSFNYG